METFLYPEKEAIADEKVTQSHTPIKCRENKRKILPLQTQYFLRVFRLIHSAVK